MIETERFQRAYQWSDHMLPPRVRLQDAHIIALLRETWPIGLSRKGIAWMLDRRLTPSLIKRLDKMVADGKLIAEMQEWPNGARGNVYYYKFQEDRDG